MKEKRLMLYPVLQRTGMIGLLFLVAACSTEPDASAVPARSDQADPPGAAAALSLGGTGLLKGKSEFDNALRCTVSLKVTLGAVTELTGAKNTPEMRTLQQVEDEFRQKAVLAGARDGKSEAVVNDAVDRQVRAAHGNVAEQGQMAMACLKARQIS